MPSGRGNSTSPAEACSSHTGAAPKAEALWGMELSELYSQPLSPAEPALSVDSHGPGQVCSGHFYLLEDSTILSGYVPRAFLG